MKQYKDISLKSYNTFGIDHKAHLLIETSFEDEVIEAISTHPSLKVLGGGSNILLTKDIETPLLRMTCKGVTIEQENEDYILIKAQAGENWHQFVRYTLQQGYGGLENLSLIYGNVGTTPVQNIGAYGVEIKDVMESCETIEIHTLQKRIFTNAECAFAYRESIFKGKEKGNYIITSVTFKLTKKNHQLHTQYGAIQQVLSERGITKPTPKELSDAIITIRESKLPNPNVLGNCGSFFKNPIILKTDYEKLQQQYPEIPCYPVKVPAGWLIDRSGLKGYRKGDAGVHKHQALVLVNYGEATGEEILAVANYVKAQVQEKFGIALEFEVNIF